MTETARVQPAATSLVASSKLVVGRALGTVVLTLHGEIVGSGSPYLATVLDDLIDGQGNLAVVVDLGDLRRLDRSAVEVLATAARSIGRKGGRLALRRPSTDAAEVLAAAGLTGLVVGVGGQPLRSSLSGEFEASSA